MNGERIEDVPAHYTQHLRAALSALRGEAVPVVAIEATAAARPGLYGFHAAASTWRELSLGTPPDDRPLYVGKAEGTLASRDVVGHFGRRSRGEQSPTGSSTLRRSLAALLAESRGYSGQPRSVTNPGYYANFGLCEADDLDLSAWMERHLRLALWPHDDAAELHAIETLVLGEVLPPLNLSKIKTPWRKQVRGARGVLANQARAWRPTASADQ